MNRKEFVVKCAACLSLGGLALLMPGCMATKYYPATIEGSDLVVPLTEFTYEKDGKIQQRKFVVAHNDKLEYPVCIYKFNDNEFAALLMQCTHQGTELQVFGDRLQCPAHGSEFTNRGRVQSGPADKNLRTFNVRVEGQQLKVNLS